MSLIYRVHKTSQYFGVESFITMALKKFNVNSTLGRFLEKVEINIIDMKLDPSYGFSYIGHVEDQYTKYAVLFPLINDSPKAMAKCLKKYFLNYFGPPVSFSSSCGDTFLSEVLCEVLECWKGDSISFTLSSGSNGKTDETQKKSKIVAKFIKDSISMMAAESSDETWVDFLPQIMLRLNVARHTSFHENPFSAVFGQSTSAYLLAEQDDLRQELEEVAEDNFDSRPTKCRSRYTKDADEIGYHTKDKTKRSREKPKETISTKETRCPTSTPSAASDPLPENRSFVNQETELDPDTASSSKLKSDEVSSFKVSESGLLSEETVTVKEEPGMNESSGICKMESGESFAVEETPDLEDDVNNEHCLEESDLEECSQPCIEMDYAEDDISDCFAESETDEEASEEKSADMSRKLSVDDISFMEKLKTEIPNITLSEIRFQLLKVKHVDVHVSTICRALKKISHDDKSFVLNSSQSQNFNVNSRLAKKDDSEEIAGQSSQTEQKKPFPVKFLRMKFNTEDDLHLRMLLNVKPLLSVDEIKQRLAEDRGLTVSAYHLTKKIASMPNNELNYHKLKDNLRKRPASEVSPEELGDLVNRNLQSKRRSYIVKGTVPCQPAVVAEEVSPQELRKLIRRNRSRKRRSYILESTGQSSNFDEYSGGSSVSPSGSLTYEDAVGSGDLDMSEVQGDIVYQDFESDSGSQHVSKHNNSVLKMSLDSVTEFGTRPQAASSDSRRLSQKTGSKAEKGIGKQNSDMSVGMLRSGKLLEDDMDFLLNLKWRNPLVTLGEMKRRLLVDRKLEIHKSTISRALKRVACAQKKGVMEAADTDAFSEDFSGDFSEDDEEILESDIDTDEEQDTNIANQLGESHNKRFTFESTSRPDGSSSSVDADGEEASGFVTDHLFKPKNREHVTVDAVTNKKLTFEDLYFVQGLKHENPKLTLREMKDILLVEKNKDVHLSTISRGLKKLGTAMILYGSCTENVDSVIDLT